MTAANKWFGVPEKVREVSWSTNPQQCSAICVRYGTNPREPYTWFDSRQEFVRLVFGDVVALSALGNMKRHQSVTNRLSKIILSSWELFVLSPRMLQFVRRHSAFVLTFTINGMQEIHPVMCLLFKLNHNWLIMVSGDFAELLVKI
jgi:hypothetical protein